MTVTHQADEPPARARRPRSERFLATLEPCADVVLVSHVNPDPDALASMLGLEALLHAHSPGKPVTLTVDGMIARAENQAMVELLGIPLVPIIQVPIGPATGVVMVDSQPHTGRHARESATPRVVIDHHETPGQLDGVAFRDIRPSIGATSTIVTGYLLEQGTAVDERLATALLYGIESEVTGYPREATSLDDGALVWLYPRADKDLLARIRNPRLPRSYFAVFHQALTSAQLYGDVVISWCGNVPHPDIVAELADFFVRFDQVAWALALGRYDGQLKLSLRADHVGGHCGEALRAVVNGLGAAGGHDRRAGGAIPLPDPDPSALDALLRSVRERFFAYLHLDPPPAQPLVNA